MKSKIRFDETEFQEKQTCVGAVVSGPEYPTFRSRSGGKKAVTLGRPEEKST